MKKESRKNRIIARGEVTGHAHIVTGEADVLRKKNGDVTIEVHGKAAIRHLLETPWVEEEQEVFTKEHKDIPLEPGKYKFVPQIEYDPYIDVIRRVKD